MNTFQSLTIDSDEEDNLQDVYNSLYDDYYKLIKIHKKISKKVNDVEHEKESLVTKCLNHMP